MFPLNAFSFLLFVALISAVSSNISGQCAGIFSNRNFKGARLNLSREIGWTYKGNFKFIPKSVKVVQNCSLTMFDGVGIIHTFMADAHNFTWISKNSVHSTCCHCGSCDKLGVGTQCARIFRHENCNICGTPMDVIDGKEMRDFRLIHNKIGSLVVRNGCQLDAYYEVKTSVWKVLVKVGLKSGNNFVEAYEPFKEEASVRLKKARCNCNVISSDSDEYEETIILKGQLNKKTDVSGKKSNSEIDNPESKEYSSISSSAEFIYKDQDQNDEDQWFYRR